MQIIFYRYFWHINEFWFSTRLTVMWRFQAASELEQTSAFYARYGEQTFVFNARYGEQIFPNLWISLKLTSLLSLFLRSILDSFMVWSCWATLVPRNVYEDIQILSHTFSNSICLRNRSLTLTSVWLLCTFQIKMNAHQTFSCTSNLSLSSLHTLNKTDYFISCGIHRPFKDTVCVNHR